MAEKDAQDAVKTALAIGRATSKAKIPAGEFVMGCVEGDVYCGSDEKPAHKVHLNSFYLDKYESARKDFIAVMGITPAGSPDCGPKCPVQGVSWAQAHAYCEKVGKRLPTEAEWEYAARAGSTSIYYWGDEMNEDYAWFTPKSPSNKTGAPENEKDAGPHPSGQKKPNAWMIYDMIGNVEEWVQDWYDKDFYSLSSAKSPGGPNEGTFRTLRGGSWKSSPPGGMLRVSGRYGYVPGNNKGPFGFRCALDIDK